METLVVTRAGGVVTVMLNRPEKRNAITRLMWEELRQTFNEIRHQPDDRVVVLTGAGDAFSAGADLWEAGVEPRHGLASMRVTTDVCFALHRLPQPTIAKVPGVAAGAAVNLAFGCDLIVTSDQARFSEIFVKRGLSIDGGGSWLLPRLIGIHKAKEIALFGDMLSAQEAADLGLVNRVVPHAELDSFVDGWAHRLAAGPPIAMAMTKRMLNNSYLVTMEQALEDEGASQTINFATKDTREAVSAFVEKRDPTFEGR